MATIYWDPQAAVNGSGESDASPKNTLGTVANGDIIRPKYGSFGYFSSQWNWGTATSVTMLPYGDSSYPLPRITIDTGLTSGLNIQGDGTHKFYSIRFENGTNNVNGGIIGLGLVAASGYGASAEFYGCEWSGTYGHGIFTGASGSSASRSVIINNCSFHDIGHDTFFGGADQFEMSYCRVDKLSTRTNGGDGLGWFGVDPSMAWVHHNTIRHDYRNVKHCIIFDVATTNSGLMIVEDNDLFGYGDENTVAGAVNDYDGTAGNVVINGDGRMIIRRNRIRTAGIAVSLSGENSVVSNNGVLVRNGEVSRPVIGMLANGCTVSRNVLVATRSMPSGHVGIALGSVSTGIVQNNILVGFDRAVQTAGGGGTTLTASNNSFYRCATNYYDNTAGAAWVSGGGDVTTDPKLIDESKPWLGVAIASPCRGAGLNIGGGDINRSEWTGKDDIGCKKIHASRNMSSRVIATRLVVYRDINAGRSTAGA